MGKKFNQKVQNSITYQKIDKYISPKELVNWTALKFTCCFPKKKKKNNQDNEEERGHNQEAHTIKYLHQITQ